MAINITKKNFQTIKILLQESYVAKNLFSSKKLLEEFIGCNCVYISGKPALIYLNDAEALLGIIKANGYNVNCIEDLDYFIEDNNDYDDDTFVKTANQNKENLLSQFDNKSVKLQKK